MSDRFFNNPILNSPYVEPMRHWELDDNNQPTGEVIDSRRVSSFVTPVVPPSRQQGAAQSDLDIENPVEVASEQQQYQETNAIINEIRGHIDQWRRLPNPNDWGVTHTTRELLTHWRSANFDKERPFFCQVEAVETIIWLTEVAPGQRGRAPGLLNRLRVVSHDANPWLERWALKMATGSGKTTVMAMLIAWQTLNAMANPRSANFTNNFLIVTPGITIKNRLQVLLPNHPDNYYAQRQLVPTQMLERLGNANIVITNYHAFMLRERLSLSKSQREILQGREVAALRTKETDGQMMQRVMPLLMDKRRGVMVLNDEGHHCYRRRPDGDSEESKLTAEERAEATKNEEAARVWLTGLEAIQDRIGINRIIDLSATPFFLRGSGYAEGTLFPWTVSDFGLMDAIECGIVKLPRVPVVDDAQTETPVYRNLWKNVATDVRAVTKGTIATLHPDKVPAQLQSAILALYRHYESVDASWRQQGIEVPPCFIIVCNNTKTSKLVYDWVSGRRFEDDDGNLREMSDANCELFSNYDAAGEPLARPNTILIDSQQLESGETLSTTFKRVAGEEIEAFKRELATVRGQGAATDISDAELLREVANSVGKPRRLGANIRCVVSVSMLTEGWDANTVTHILGIRAFGTQLLCEQVVGRALRRYEYDLQPDGMFEAQYADVFGVPFDFTAKPTISPPKPPKPATRVRAIPERSELEIRFPRIEGYTVRRDRHQKLIPRFNKDSEYRLLADIPTQTVSQDVTGGTEVFADQLHAHMRRQEVLYRLTSQLLERLRERSHNESDTGDLVVELPIDYRIFYDLKEVVNRWINEYVLVIPPSSLGLLAFPEYYETACTKLIAAFDRHDGPLQTTVQPIINRYSPYGSSADVDMTTTKDVYQTSPDKCHVSHVVLDSSWERAMAEQLELHPNVIAYVKNAGLGLEVPYTIGGQRRSYLPDFIARFDTGHDEPLNVLIEVKGLRRDDVAEKSTAARDYWIPAVNNLADYGRWAWAYCDDVSMFRSELDKAIRADSRDMGARR